MRQIQDTPPNPKLAAFLVDPSVSYWLRDAIRSALERDCVDALRDAEELVEILKERCDL